MFLKKIPQNHLINSKLQGIPSPPKKLYIKGTFSDSPYASIVGSRKYSTYGKHATEYIVSELCRQGIGVVSGLALGIDSVAHRACLDAGGVTHAVLPSGLDNVYPASHRNLAKMIIDRGGSLISEYEPNDKAFRSHFVARNRIVAGLGDVLIVIEASQRSGTMHTVNFALEQGKEIFAVPGPINSPTSKGTNQLIQNGAQLLQDPNQVIDYFGFKTHKKPTQAQLIFDDEHQGAIYALLTEGQVLHADVLHAHSKLPVNEFNQALSMLEIYGHIKNVGNNSWIRT